MSGPGHVSVLAALLSLFAIVSFGGLIYEDTLQGTGSLSGYAPDIRPGSVTWTCYHSWVRQGDGTIYSSVNAPRSAYLPFVPQAGRIYTLTYFVRVTADGIEPFEMGFLENGNLGETVACSDNASAPWIGLGASDGTFPENSTGIIQSWADDVSQGSVGSPREDVSVFNTFRITLVTTGADWEVSFKLIKPDSSERDFGTHSYAGGNPDIGGVGFAMPGTLDRNTEVELWYFRLEETVVADREAPAALFSESFEVSDGMYAGALHGQHGWSTGGKISLVQATEFKDGAHALQLQEGSAVQFVSNTHDSVWLTCWVRHAELPEVSPVVVDPERCLGFYVNTNGMLTVYSNAVPVELAVSIVTNAWTRFDIFCDFDVSTWNLSMNQSNVVAGLPFDSGNGLIDFVQVQNASASSVYVDELSIADQEPVVDPIDTDGDTLPDWWEQKHFGGISNAAPSTPNLNAYIAGLGPGVPFRLASFPLRWAGQPGRRYSVYGTTNLLSGFDLLQAGIPWDETSYTNFGNANEPHMFYIIKVELDD